MPGFLTPGIWKTVHMCHPCAHFSNLEHIEEVWFFWVTRWSWVHFLPESRIFLGAISIKLFGWAPVKSTEVSGLGLLHWLMWPQVVQCWGLNLINCLRGRSKNSFSTMLQAKSSYQLNAYSCYSLVLEFQYLVLPAKEITPGAFSFLFSQPMHLDESVYWWGFH